MSKTKAKPKGPAYHVVAYYPKRENAFGEVWSGFTGTFICVYEGPGVATVAKSIAHTLKCGYSIVRAKESLKPWDARGAH